MSQKKEFFKTTRDGGLIVSKDALERAADSVKIPQTDTAYGAGFGDTITDDDRAFAATREPVGNLLTYQVAADIVDKWFTVGDPDTEEADPALDRTVQDALISVKARKHLLTAIESERIFGKSLLIGAFTDAQNIDSLKKPLTMGSELKQLSVYPKVASEKKVNAFTVETKDENPNSARFGEPVVYKLDRGSGNYLYVHYTRCFELQTRSNGASVLDPVWDDLSCGRNIRWGAGQWMYRNGSGFPVFEFPEGTTETQLETASNAGIANNLMNRKYILIAQNSLTANTGMKFHFEGALGRTLDPSPFFRTNDEQIAKGSGIPQPRLIGAQAGAVTGSEVNVADYYKVVSREQVKLEDMIRWVIDHLADSGQISLVKSGTATDKLKETLKRVFNRDYRHKTAKTYVVEWNSAFEQSEKEEAEIDKIHADTRVAQLGYMSKDEVRALDNLEPLPNGAGEWKEESFNPEEDFVVRPPKGKQPQKGEEKNEPTGTNS
jgi:hypothetical protein